MRRVAITGIGVVSPIGLCAEDFWKSLSQGRHGFAAFGDEDSFDGVMIAAKVKGFDAETAGIPKKDARRMDKFTAFAVASAIEAMSDCGSDFADIDCYRKGVIFASGIGGFETIEAEHRKFIERGPSRVSALLIPTMIVNIAPAQISMRFGFKGLNYTPVTACASSTHAIGDAFRSIKHGYADVIIAGGAEASITPFAVAGFENMGALCKSDNPDRASIPFDKDRNGFVMGEGAGSLVLEEYEHAKKRGAKIYAEIVGYGATADAYHITSPSPDAESSARAIELSVAEAGIALEEVGYLNAHGTSTPLNDKYETLAIKKAFGEHAQKLLVSSTKSMTGHLLGAAGAVEALATALMLKEGLFAPTAGLLNGDEECDLDYIPQNARRAAVEYAVSNSLGFGGQNAAICLKKGD